MSVDRQHAYYLDAAKVISACLVVYWHTVFEDAIINSLLLPMRMPLFFLISGFFARKAMTLDWRTFATEKFLRLMYLYVLWTVILCITLDVPVAVMKGREAPVGELLWMFIDPPRTIWFLYALALAYLIGYATFRFPRAAVVIVAFGMYFIPDLLLESDTDGDLLVRLCRLVPFFLLSLRYGGEVRHLIEARRTSGPICVLAYFPVALLAFEAEGLISEIGFMIASFIGVFGLLNALWRIEAFRITQYLASFGPVTIYIFLLHRYTITACNFIAGKAGFEINPWSGLIVAALAVVISVFIGRHIIAPHLPWLEKPFWDIMSQKAKVAR